MNGTTDKLTAAATELIGGDLMNVLTGAFEQMDWAEDEIRRAQKRHPGAADRIWHSFKLLSPGESKGCERFGVEFVYRSHCRELLERVAAGQDTRPGTAAEVAIACCEAGKIAPLTETGYALAARMWPLAFPGKPDPWAEMREHYEALRSSLTDDLEREARRKTGSPDRRTGDIECRGQHHGEPVKCAYAKPAHLELTSAA